ncbi:ferritin light chain 1-like [Elephas maximus indicus]|uniref:ferritin light chain 1-like n=1 Tax=Elephas maximus indicus TaxID=99487 RepID=UPI0021169DA1|nr:ferritin light chain 1-like [Elephas maximus indicus]
MNLQIHQNFSTDGKVIVNHLANLHLWTSYVYFSLGIYFNLDIVVLMCRNHPKMSEVESWMLRKLSLAMEMNLNHTLGSSRMDPHLCGFLESNFLDKEVKLIKKMGNHLTGLSRLAGP